MGDGLLRPVPSEVGRDVVVLHFPVIGWADARPWEEITPPFLRGVGPLLVLIGKDVEVLELGQLRYLGLRDPRPPDGDGGLPRGDGRQGVDVSLDQDLAARSVPRDEQGAVALRELFGRREDILRLALQFPADDALDAAAVPERDGRRLAAVGSPQEETVAEIGGEPPALPPLDDAGMLLQGRMVVLRGLVMVLFLRPSAFWAASSENSGTRMLNSRARSRAASMLFSKRCMMRHTSVTSAWNPHPKQCTWSS